MPYYKFGKNDLFRNVITTYPEVSFYIYGLKSYYQNQDRSIINSNSPSGYVNLYELNVNRAADNLIYPFMPKDSTLTKFKFITTSSFDSTDYGTIVDGTYPMTASISAHIYTGSAIVDRKYVEALKNVLNERTLLTPHYAFSASYGDFEWNKGTQHMTLIDIPSIFYGSKIKKGSVKLDFFISGSSQGQLIDKNRDGALYQVSGNIADNDDKVGGVVLYEEGILLLTGSWDLNAEHTARYNGDSLALTNPKWNAFGRLTEITPSSSYSIDFSGSQITPVLTMMCQAPAGELNFSQNPTFVNYTTTSSAGTYQTPLDAFSTSSVLFQEIPGKKIKNTVSSSYECYDANFQKQTFISKIGVYDANNNLIAIANLARPVRKTENRDLTFKLKLDI